MTSSPDSDVILVTGGTGFIGSHIVVELIEHGYFPVILDNLSNSPRSVVGLIEQLTGSRPPFIQADVRDTEAVRHVLQRHKPYAVVHCAGRKSVPESVAHPERYLGVNVGGSLSLLEEWLDSPSPCFVFSSSCTVYGAPRTLPVDESSDAQPQSPYGWSKLIVDQMMAVLASTHTNRSFVSLRYFNPVGAHSSGLIGDKPTGQATSLMPLIMEVAARQRPHLEIFGADYPTPDGTAIRDYVHVVDIAKAHVAAIKRLSSAFGAHVLNLGRGRGLSVLEMCNAFESSTGVSVPRVVSPRRLGDAPEIWCDTQQALDRLGWTASRTLDEMCTDGWRFFQMSTDEPLGPASL